MMKLGRNILLLGIVLIILLVVVVSFVRAGQPIIHIDKNIIFTTEPFVTEQARPELVVLGQSSIETTANSVSEGDVVLISWGGAPVTIQGRVEGDLTAIGSRVIFDESAFVEGDAFLIGEMVEVRGQIEGDLQLSGATAVLANSARIGGEIEDCLETSGLVRDERMDASALIPCKVPPEGNSVSPVLALVVGSVFLTGLTALAVTIFPYQISQIEAAIRRRSGRTLGFGLALLAIFIGLTGAVLLALAFVQPLLLVLIPIYLVFVLVMGFASLAGSITLSIILGDWLLKRLGNAHPLPLLSALLGALLLLLPVTVLAALPATGTISFFLTVAISAIGLGAALDTRFGTRNRERRYFVQG
jgi:hypothetical protein